MILIHSPGADVTGNVPVVHMVTVVPVVGVVVPVRIKISLTYHIAVRC